MNIERIIFLIIICLPIIDIFTAFTLHLAISIGALIRTIIMALLVLLTLTYFYHTRAYTYFSTYVAALLIICLSFMSNFYLKENFSLFEEVNFSLKTIYFITMIYTAIYLIEKSYIKIATLLRATSIAAIIIGVTYWGAILFNQHQNSYTYDKLGTSGLFFAANELSVIILLLLACTMIGVIFLPNMMHLIAFFLLISMSTMIGTKTALYGGIFLLTITVFVLPFVMRVKKQLSIAFMAILFFTTVPFSPAMKNHQAPKADAFETAKITNNQSNVLLSSRDVYVSALQHDFSQAHPIRKLFGIGYGGDQEVAKMAEMDFHDLFFSYGYIGTVILLLPLLLTAFMLIQIPYSFAKILLGLTIPLWLGISFTAGHMMFAPAVMSYVVIFILLVGLLGEYEVQDEATS